MTAAGERIRLVIADDHEVVRRGVRTILEAQPGWTVVGEAATGRGAVEIAAELKPDIAILDVSMPDLNGIDATRQILAAVPDAEVLILSFHDTEQVVRDALRAGARGYVLKADALQMLVVAVESLRRHKPFVSSGVSRMVIDGYLHAAEPELSEERLTSREREVLQLLAEGRMMKEAAGLLGVSAKTVETHRTSLTKKLGLKTLGDLIRYAIRNHIIEA